MSGLINLNIINMSHNDFKVGTAVGARRSPRFTGSPPSRARLRAGSQAHHPPAPRLRAGSRAATQVMPECLFRLGRLHHVNLESNRIKVIGEEVRFMSSLRVRAQPRPWWLARSR